MRAGYGLAKSSGNNQGSTHVAMGDEESLGMERRKRLYKTPKTPISLGSWFNFSSEPSRQWSVNEIGSSVSLSLLVQAGATTESFLAGVVNN